MPPCRVAWLPLVRQPTREFPCPNMPDLSVGNSLNAPLIAVTSVRDAITTRAFYTVLALRFEEP